MLGAENGAIEFQIRTWPSLAFLSAPGQRTNPGQLEPRFPTFECTENCLNHEKGKDYQYEYSEFGG
jgi:hypothetical protein